jgi:putative Holliday junction resolvase
MANRVAALGLDIGRKRIGVAGCDGTGLIATGLTTIIRGAFAADLVQYQALVEARQVKILVVGLPYRLDGSLGFQARQIQKYAKRLAKVLNLPLEYVDERLTSVEAEELIRATGLSPSQNKALVDRKAAALILQRWLDQRHLEPPPLP